jgi:RHS repeat-associated protein
VGGIHFAFTDGTNADSATDQSGLSMAADGDQSETTWQLRTIHLTSYAGKKVSVASLVAGPQTPAGSWFLVIAKAAIVSTNGTVTQIYNQSPSMGLSFSGTSGVTNAGSSVATFSYIQKPVETTNYYIGDQIGSARMEIGAEGWPVSADTYYPFGQELAPSASPNNYKFTGKERDSESGNDYFGDRYYASTMGRFLSPDPGNAGVHRTNPQSWNAYSYANNRPTSLIDPNGLEPVKAQAETIAGFANKLNNTTHKIGQLTGTAAQNALKRLHPDRVLSSDQTRQPWDEAPISSRRHDHGHEQALD